MTKAELQRLWRWRLVGHGFVLLGLLFLAAQAARYERTERTEKPDAQPEHVNVVAPLAQAGVIAQSQTVTASGGTSQQTGGGFTNAATLGQPVAGRATGGRFATELGFWAESNAPTLCPPLATFPTTLPTGLGGTPYSASAAASPSGTYVYSFTGALPNGLNLNTASGAITGTPLVAGTFNFTITATRFGNCAASQAYTVSIACPAIDVLPKPSGPLPTLAFALPAATAGRPYTTTISANPVGGAYSFSIVAPGFLPNGLTLNPNTGVISGTPSATGNFSFRMQATGFGSCSGSRAYSLRVNAPTAFAALAAKAGQMDFDGDGKSDLWDYRAVDGRWLIQRSSDGVLLAVQLGALDDAAVPADYDGDGQTDVAVYNAATQRWQVRQSSDGVLREEVFGAEKAQAYPADYDGDGRADFAVRTAQGEWQIRHSRAGAPLSFTLGAAEDRAVIGDFDGDGLTDAAVFRAVDKLALIRRSSDGAVQETFLPYAEGAPVAADFDGDQQAELAFWSAEKATLTFRRSTDQQEQQLTLAGSALLLGDYDGDGRSDCLVWREAGQSWRQWLSSRRWANE